MELQLAITSLETAHVPVSTTRPTAAGDGIDISALKVASFSFADLIGYLKRNAADVTITSPTNGTKGVEVWAYKADKAGVSAWWLEGYVNGGADVVVVGGGFRFDLRLVGDASRICIAGTSSDLTKIPTSYFEPIEHIMQLVQ